MPLTFQLHFDVTNGVPDGSTIIVDSSDSPLVWTAATDTPGQPGISVSNLRPRVGTGSLRIGFNTRSYVTANDPRLVIGDQDFVYSAWHYFIGIPGGIMFLMDTRNGGSIPGFCIYTNAGDLSVAIDPGIGGGSGIHPVENQWHAIVLYRISGIYFFYFNGVLIKTFAAATTLTSAMITIGAAQYTPQGINAAWGFLDEAQMAIGPVIPVFKPARSLANFTKTV